MRTFELLAVFVISTLAVSVSHFPLDLQAQFQNSVKKQTSSGNTNNTSGNTNSTSGNSVVSVSSSIAIPVSNQTSKMSETTLKSSVTSFLNSGPNVLKTSDARISSNTKIINKINNDTQNVQGGEATSAIVGVEISKALKTIVPPTSQQNKASLITITTSSTCKPSSASVIACDNTVEIK
jgi:hypothetical protein